MDRNLILQQEETRLFEDDAMHLQPAGLRRRSTTSSLPRLSQTGTSITSDTMSHFSGLSLSPSLDESISDNDDFYFEEEEEEEEEETKNEERQRKETKKLTQREEKAIALKARRQLAAEFSKLKREGREKMTHIKKKFKTVIDDARSALIAARIEAEKESINRLEESAEQKHDLIKKKRLERRKQLQKELADKNKGNSANALAQLREGSWVKLEVDEMASLRKIQADLDRAKARRRYSIAAAVKTSKGRVRVRNLMQTEVRRLEKAEEVHKLILELHELDLRQHAIRLTHALKDREDKEEKLRNSLKEEAAKVKMQYEKRKEEEILLLREERFDQLERLELERLRKEKERIEREEREKRERVMAALKRKAHNQAMRRNMEITWLSTRISRPYNFSYFPQPTKKN